MLIRTNYNQTKPCILIRIKTFLQILFKVCRTQTLGRWQNKSICALPLVCRHPIIQRFQGCKWNREKVTREFVQPFSCLNSWRCWRRSWASTRCRWQWRGILGVSWYPNNQISWTKSAIYNSCDHLCKVSLIMLFSMETSEWNVRPSYNNFINSRPILWTPLFYILRIE